METKQAVVTFSGFIKYSWQAGLWGYKTNNNEPTSILTPPASWHVPVPPSDTIASLLHARCPSSQQPRRRPGHLVGFSPLLILGAKAKKEGAVV